MTDTLARLKDALADRYVIERELGQGGMATVYLAQDRKLGRAVALKVLKPELAASLGGERFLREIEIAAKLTHPHILTLYDCGEAGGQLYYTMPFVEGESLRDRLEREKQLPLDHALQITKEVADALGYAHALGLVHRDIKPENILFEAGHAVVADFGIARAVSAAGARLTETGLAVGTPAYMSPEQAAGSQDLDGRSDLYALGCVLYEMLSGETPYTGPTPQAILAKKLSEPLPRVSVVRDSVPPAIEAALNKALARTPADRFATAQQFAASLAEPRQSEVGTTAPRKWRFRGSVVIGAFVVAALAIVGGFRVLSSSGIDFAARDWIVVTEFENRTGDSVFEGSLGAAFTIGLAQSRYLNVLPRGRMADILRQMERPDTTRLDEKTGREVALRANVRVFVVPGISRIDSTYLVTTRIADPQTGTDLLTRSRRVEGRGRVLTALDDLVRQLRRDLGESRRAVAQNGLRLDQATTSSLEALRAWTEGNQYWNTRRFVDAGERYRAALRLDSSFAMAHRSLGQYHALQQQRDSSEYHFAKALSRFDRLTERERLLIQGAVYGARGNWDEALRVGETYVERYPDDLGQRYSLGTSYMRADRYEDAIRTLRQVVAIDSTHVSAHINLATTYAMMDRCAEALPYYRRAFALRPEFRLSGNLNHEFGFNFVCLGQLDSAAATFTAMLAGATDPQAQGHRSLALLLMYRGRYAEARSHLEQAIVRNRMLHAPVSEFRNRLYLIAIDASTARAHDLESDLRAVRGLADRVALGPTWLSRLAGSYARLGDTVAVARLVALIRQRVAPGSTEDQAAAAGSEARLAIARRNYPQAIELLQRAILDARGMADEFRPRLARAYQSSGEPERAAAVYRELIGTKRALGWEPQEAWILAHYELGRIYEGQGDTAKAVDYYGRFVDIWKDGDAGLVALADARGRLRALAGSDAPRGAREPGAVR